MKTTKVYHGVKGERVTMVDKQNRGKSKLSCYSYEEQKIKDLAFAIIVCAIGVGLLWFGLKQ